MTDGVESGLIPGTNVWYSIHTKSVPWLTLEGDMNAKDIPKLRTWLKKCHKEIER